MSLLENASNASGDDAKMIRQTALNPQIIRKNPGLFFISCSCLNNLMYGV
ncbi:hypothetical protein KL86SPO_30256 [uncultured Sporomusa sp.]|uniref:Uncharacterized protein n=1 Tax=uncultured Sporomusa sp. TaxID=307249 RepID=A0A212LRA6_9FIRM|nr:hypothetical protein KL86SPO_30256 [uncultured Sporomusa sp.]